MPRPVLVALAAASAALASTASTPSARTWYVDSGGTGDAPTIPAAMDSAASGDSVVVMPGTYPGAIPLVSGVTLIGDGGPEQTTIDAESTGIGLDGGEPLRRALVDVLVEGLTLTGVRPAPDRASGGCAVGVTGAIVLRNCAVIHNQSVGTAVIRVRGSLTLDGCLVAWNSEAGIDFDGDGTGMLRIAHSTIQECIQPAVAVRNGTLEITDSVVRANEDAFRLGDGNPGYLAATLERNVFIGNRMPIRVLQPTNDGVAIRHNTFTDGTDWALGPFLGLSVVIHANLLGGGNLGGLILCASCTQAEVTCNDSWGNRGSNWLGFPDPTGQDGNLSVPPRYCDPENEDFSLGADSPCLPANNECGVQIGALGQGCAAVAIETDSWGAIKARYRPVSSRIAQSVPRTFRSR